MQIFQQLLYTIPGMLAMTAVAVLAIGGADFGFPQWPGLEALLSSHPLTKRFLVDALHFNYVILCILIGIILRNAFGIPALIRPGIRTSRLFIKTGVILLGSLYSINEIVDIGLTALLMITFFVFSTMMLTLYLGRRVGLDPESAALLAAGTSICGVSAIVATAPAVQAKSSDVVYSIGTILSVGLVFLFAFPIIGGLLELSHHQFGVWAGTGILNSGQVLAATLAYDANNLNSIPLSLKTGEIYNLMRVLLLPFVVLILSIYINQRKPSSEDYEVNTSFFSKFPLFVIGFIIVVIMTSLGLLGQTHPPSPELIAIRKLYKWFFAAGLTGLSMQISFNDLRVAGGKVLLVGVSAALYKALTALLIVILFFD